MSQENVEVVRRWAWAFDHDTDAFRVLIHPDIEWMPVEDNHTPSYGLDGAMAIRNGWLDPWSEHSVEIEELIDAGDDVFALVHLTARGAGSGAEVDIRVYGHLKVRDGKVVYFYEYEDRAEALKAVGLEE